MWAECTWFLARTEQEWLLRQLIVWNPTGLAFAVHIPLGILVFWTTRIAYYYLFIVILEFPSPKPTKSSCKPATAMAPHFCTRLGTALAIVLTNERKCLEKSNKRMEGFTLAQGLRGQSIHHSRRKYYGRWFGDGRNTQRLSSQPQSGRSWGGKE